MALYFATKAFVLSLSEGLHEELKPHGVHVSGLVPGADPDRIRRRRRLRRKPLFERLAMESPEVVEAGLEGSTTTARWSSPGS